MFFIVPSYLNFDLTLAHTHFSLKDRTISAFFSNNALKIGYFQYELISCR